MKIKKKFLLLVLIVVLSNLVFTADIKVKSPNGGESWAMGSEQLIKWEKSGHFTKNEIILFKGNKSVGSIGWEFNPHSTSFLWKKVGKYIGGKVGTGNDYKIRVKGYLLKESKVDDSDANLEITDKEEKESQIGKMNFKLEKIITVISPRGGKYVTGQKLHISWKLNFETYSKDTMVLELYSGDEKKYRRALCEIPAHQEYYNWTIPGDIRPEFYTIKISYQNKHQVSKVGSRPEEVCGFSGKFHIAKSYETKTLIIKGATFNSIGVYKRGGVYRCAKHNPPDADPGPSKIRVGSNFRKSRDFICYYYYRSHVSFTLKSVPKGSVVQQAALKYEQYKGDSCPINVYVLDQKWNKNESLSLTKATYHENPGDFRKVVNKWLAFPNANYGVFFIYLNDKRGRRCVSFFKNIYLVLKIQVPTQ